MAPDADGLIALEDDAIAIVLGHLQDGIIRIRKSRVLCLERGGLFEIVLLKDVFAIDHRKRGRWQAGLVVEIRVFGNSAVSVLHADGRRHLIGSHLHGIAHNLGLGRVPFFVCATKAKMIQ